MSNQVFLTVKEASKHADVSEHTVRRILRLIRSEPEKVYNQLPSRARNALAESPYQLEGKVLKMFRVGRHTNSPIVYQVSQMFIDSFFNVHKEDSVLMINSQDNESKDNREAPSNYVEVPTMQKQGRDGLETILVTPHKKRGRKKIVSNATPLVDDDTLIGMITDMQRQIHSQEYQIQELTQQNKELVGIVRQLLNEKSARS